MKTMRNWIREHKKIITRAVLLIVAYIFLNPIYYVSVGHKGVVIRLGAVSGTILNEGINWRWPLIEKIEEVSIQIQKTEIKSESASKDLQTVSTAMALNFHLSPAGVGELFKHVGVHYNEKIIEPAVLETMKAVTAQFTASELVTKRETVSDKIKEQLKEKLKIYHLIVDEISMKDFDFSKSFNESIELKQKAEQDALKAENDLKRIRVEAEQKVAEARAEAEAYRLKSQQITQGMIEMERIKKWDGKYPQVVNGGGMMLQMPIR